MKVKATVILNVRDVKTWEEAYEIVFAFAGHSISTWHSRHKFLHASVAEVIEVEGVTDTPASQQGAPSPE